MTVLIDIVKDQARSENGQRAAALSAKYETMTAQEILRDAIRNEFFGDITLSSSFGADSAVLLHMVSEIDPSLPVLFLDTDRHFFQTLQYRDELKAKLGLQNLVVLKADETEAASEDAKGTLWRTNPDACCDLRKVRPLNRIMEGGKHFKVNPLAGWTQDDLDAYFARYDLPHHPLIEQGFPSIGCFTCTKPVETGQDARSGRWAGTEKVECGIHNPIYGGEGI
ncbi:MAG: phosphoadenosine phosphosulfate reductase [Asticcacaulis sp.]|nr:phosphoadenosine phosphosulfate reductase [Asticcacaulis sp.]